MSEILGFNEQMGRLPVSKLISKAIANKSTLSKSTPLKKIIRPATPAKPVLRPATPAKPVLRPAIPVSKLIKTTNPIAVKSVNPIQRSYMPVDLPYETMNEKNQPKMKLTATNFELSTDLDMVQPPVDSGMSNYYGK